MSLKAFHIFFVLVSILFTGFFGHWTITEYQTGGGAGYLALCSASVAFGAGLVWYFFWFLRKLKREGALQS